MQYKNKKSNMFFFGPTQVGMVPKTKQQIAPLCLTYLQYLSKIGAMGQEL